MLAELDSVLDSYHSAGNKNNANSKQAQVTAMNTSGGSSSSSGPAKSGKKKRSSKTSSSSSSSDHRGGGQQIKHHPNQTEPAMPLKSPSSGSGSGGRGGGTWPRTRGGPVIDQGTGTILHPQKVKKERLPLSELLNNLPKYPPEKKKSSGGHSEQIITRATPSRRTAPRPLTTYGGMMEASADREAVYRPLEPASLPLQFIDQQQGIRTASSGIDDSVKSAHPGKDALAKYLRKAPSSTLKSPSPSSNPPSSMALSHHLTVYPSAAASAASPSYAALKSPHDMVSARGEPSPYGKPSFSPYFAAPPPPAGPPPPPPQSSSSSPRYSSPPPLVSAASGDSLLGSPIPDYRNAGISSSAGGHFDPGHQHPQYSMSPTSGTGVSSE